MTKPKLSVVLATFNEEKNISNCLKSVIQIADEIIVVDGSSRDKTRQIAKKYKAKIFKVKNLPMFHTNKQKAVNQASGVWILQLDADEQLTPALRQEVKTIINQKKSLFMGYYLPRKNFFLAHFLTKGGQYPDYVIRLFKNGKGRFPCKSIHEQIKIDGSIGYLKNPLLHFADRNFNHYLIRFNRYTSLEAVDLKKQGIKPTSLMAIKYFIFKPLGWFFKAYFRHLGLVDGIPGFVFALMSSLRFPITYMKLWELYHARRV